MLHRLPFLALCAASFVAAVSAQERVVPVPTSAAPQIIYVNHKTPVISDDACCSPTCAPSKCEATCSKAVRSCNGCTLGAPIECDSCPRPTVRLGFSCCNTCPAPTCETCCKPAPCPKTTACSACSKPAPVCQACTPKCAPAPTCCNVTPAPKATCGCKDVNACSDECTGERHRPLLSLLRRLVSGRASHGCTDTCCGGQVPQQGTNNVGERIVPVPVPSQPAPVQPMPPATTRPLTSAPQFRQTIPQLPPAPMPFEAQPTSQQRY